MASYSGLPGASRCDCPTNSSRRCGRMRSASGRRSRARSSASSDCCGVLRRAMTQVLELALRRADDIDTRRRRELQRRRIDVRIALAVREIELHGLAEPVLDDHPGKLIAAESEFCM